uniref:SFRICE_016815 n=1 Tax=Spodoptera frugiperda TaxID=7108 RepID=A0A2H1WUK6_SPOFR
MFSEKTNLTVDEAKENSAPMWEEFISKATKLHSALKSALVAIAAFLDAFQKIADAATNARDLNQLRALRS